MVWYCSVVCNRMVYHGNSCVWSGIVRYGIVCNGILWYVMVGDRMV